MAYKEFPTHADADEARRAIDVALGLPSRDFDEPWCPTEFFPGAPGWTESECAIHDARDESGTACLQTTERADATNAQTVTLDGNAYTIDLSGAIEELPAKYLA